MISDFLNDVQYKGQALGSGGTVNVGGGKKPWKNSGVPAMWGNFAAWAGGDRGPINQGYQNALSALVEGSAGQQDAQEMALADKLAELGINPAMAATIMASQTGMFAGQLGAGKAQLAQKYNQDILDLGLGTTNAIAQGAQFDATGAYNEWALGQQKKMAKKAALMGLVGDLAGAAAFAFGGPAAGAATSATKAASSFGGQPGSMIPMSGIPYGYTQPWKPL